MRLWLLSQTANNDYDTFDALVVAAETEDEARLINPATHLRYGGAYGGGTWCEHPNQVTVKLLGDAVPGTEAGIILGSFNAG